MQGDRSAFPNCCAPRHAGCYSPFVTSPAGGANPGEGSRGRGAILVLQPNRLEVSMLQAITRDYACAFLVIRVSG